MILPKMEYIADNAETNLSAAVFANNLEAKIIIQSNNFCQLYNVEQESEIGKKKNIIRNKINTRFKGAWDRLAEL